MTTGCCGASILKSLFAALAPWFLAALAAQTDPPLDEAACTAPEGWAHVVARDPDFVVFGELRTNEAPAFVQNLLCGEARQNRRRLLAVEHSSWQDQAWQEAWALPNEAFRAALPCLDWRDREDGLASEAMLQLVLAAHAFKERGASIDIVAFNGARDDAQRARFAELPGQGAHKAAQAQNIA